MAVVWRRSWYLQVKWARPWSVALRDCRTKKEEGEDRGEGRGRKVEGEWGMGWEVRR